MPSYWRILGLSRLADQARRFTRRVLRYHDRCVRIENVFRGGKLKVTDVELVYSSSFLSLCSQWEALLEEILYEVVCGEQSKRSGNVRYVEFKSRQNLRDVLLFPTRSYLSIPSLKRAEELAELFVKEGRPISAVSAANRSRLAEAVKIRNAIAHESDFARKKFREAVPGVSALPRSKRLPGAFLRHQFRQSPSQRRYEVYFAAYRSASTEIANAW